MFLKIKSEIGAEFDIIMKGLDCVFRYHLKSHEKSHKKLTKLNILIFDQPFESKSRRERKKNFDWFESIFVLGQVKSDTSEFLKTDIFWQKQF